MRIYQGKKSVVSIKKTKISQLLFEMTGELIQQEIPMAINSFDKIFQLSITYRILYFYHSEISYDL